MERQFGAPAATGGVAFIPWDRLSLSAFDLETGAELARLLSRYDVKLNYVSPGILRMPGEVMDEVSAKGIPQAEFVSLEKVLPETDVLYVTRVQKERFEDPADYEKVAGAFVIDPEVMKAAKDEMIVMHPLPRVNEISTAFDDDPRAAYFRQMEYGLYVRMALLAMVLGKASLRDVIASPA